MSAAAVLAAESTKNRWKNSGISGDVIDRTKIETIEVKEEEMWRKMEK